MRRLVIRPGAIGDCILSLPALAYLAGPGTELWIPRAVVPLCAELAKSVRPLASTGIDRVLNADDLAPGSPLAERLKSFDSIVSWYGTNRPAFREALLSTGARCEFHAALPPPGYNGHASDFFLKQVRAPQGSVPRITLPPSSRRDTVVIHPFSGSALKNWPLSHYQELGARLRCPVGWTAGPEEHLAEAVRFPDLRELAEWIAGARLYIGNDSGITHLAAATGVATLALFGPTAPQTWAPRGNNVTVLRSEPMDLLNVDVVLTAASRLLGSP